MKLIKSFMLNLSERLEKLEKNMKLSNFLEVNVGKTDKIARTIIAISCLLAGFFTENNWFFLGLLPLFSVVTGRCPVYSILGVRTCPLKKSSQ